MTQVVPGPPYPGVYQHYKGGLYIVHKVIFDSGNGRNNQITVLYESIEYGTLTHRPIVEFTQLVHNGQPSITIHPPDPNCELCIPRFRLLDMGAWHERRPLKH